MIDIFKELITDFHAFTLPNPTRRDITIPVLSKEVRKAIVFIGMRRSGKTWTLYQIMQDLIAEGIEPSKILYLNFEDERLCDMKTENFQDILKAYFELYPEYSDRSDIHFFFDEIHEVAGWEKFIRRLLDQEKMKIYITGSSCKMLSREIASSLRGRTFAQEIFPFSFAEYLEQLNVSPTRKAGTKTNLESLHHLRNFLQWGGFPEVIDTTPEIHRTLLQEYIASVIYRDIIDRYGLSNSQSLKQLLSHCLRNSATIFSVNKIYHSLKSMGYEISKNTLYDYMSYFEDAYCIFSLSKFDLSQRKSANSMKKIFAIDQGLITAVTMASSFDLSAQLETAVFSHLRRQSQDIFYYRTADDTEIDFLLLLPDQSMHLFQACLSLEDENTRRREVDALITAMQELSLNEGIIITLNEEREIKTPVGTLYAIPAWKILTKSSKIGFF